MADIATLGISVDSRQARTARTDLDRLTDSGKRTEGQANQIATAFRRLAGPLAAFLSARQIAQSAEQWTTLNNRLRLVTSSTQELLAAQDAVFSIAQESRQPLEATAELYQRIATNADELGLSGAGLAGVVDTINKTLAISGTSGQAAQAALVQLGQAFASGTLRGEELNSVLEQAPALAKAIAEGMGVSVGQLRALGQEGTLTAQNVIDALTNQAAAVDAQFARVQATATQAFTTLGNSLTRMVGEIDAATGASTGLADAILGLSKYLDSGALTDDIVYAMEVWRGSISATIATLGDLSAELELLGDIGGESAGLVGQAFLDMPANIVTAIKVATVEVSSLIDRAGNAVRTLDEALAALVTRDTVGEALSRGQARYQALLQAREDSLQLIFDEREAIIGVADAEKQRREAERAERQKDRETRDAEIAAMRAAADTVALGGAQRDKEADKALKAVEKQIAALERQAATVGMNEDAVALYDLRMGGATKTQLEHAETLLRTVSAFEEQEKILGDYRDLVLELRTDEEKLTDQLRERLEVLDKMAGLSAEDRLGVATRIAGAATPDAPEFGGLAPEVGGAFGELAKIADAQTELDEWYAAQLERINQFRAERADLNAAWDAEEIALKEQHEAKLAEIEEARHRASLAAASSTFGDLADITATFAGKQSGIFKVMFAASKAFAIADAIISIQQGIAKAASLQWPQNLAAMASVASATAGIVSSIQSVRMQGMAHDGIDSVPKTGTWLLEKGERVVTSKTSEKLDRTLDKLERQGSGAPIVNLYEDKSRAGQVDSREEDGRNIIDIFVADLMGDGRAQQAISRKFGMRAVGV